MITFYVDREPRYIIGDKVYTQEEVDEMDRQRRERKTARLGTETGWQDTMISGTDTTGVTVVQPMTRDSRKPSRTRSAQGR